MKVVPVNHGSTLTLGQTRVLFELPDDAIPCAHSRSYDLHPDGRRFLVGIGGQAKGTPPITRLTLVHNWLEELNHLVPIDP